MSDTKSHEHDWQIWPETDGQEKRCSLCGGYRKTPTEVLASILGKDEPFGRQSLPTVITITGGEAQDRYEMADIVGRYLRGRVDTVETSGTPESQIIRCYPRANND